MWKLFRCSHKSFSPPVVRRRHDNVINRLQDTYVTCQQCREQFPYSLSEMRRVHERRRQREDEFESRVASAKSQIAGSRSRKEAAAQSHLIQPTGVTRPGPTTVLASKMKEADSPRAGQSNPHSLTSLHKLAYFYHSQKDYEKAERLYLEALAAGDTPEGRQHPEFEKLLNNLASVYQRMGKFQDAEFLYKRSLRMVEEQYGEYHPKAVRRLLNLAELYAEMKRSVESAQEYQRALLIAERELGSAHADTQKVVQSYSAMLRKNNCAADALAVEARLSPDKFTQSG